MSEKSGREVFSPLESAGGTTIIAETVVTQIAGMAAGEVEGIRLGGKAARRTGGMLDRATSSSKESRDLEKARGVSAKVGATEVAVDVKLGFKDGEDLHNVTGKVREKVVERVENLVGLAVTEVNLTITDIIFPEEQEREQRAEKARDEANDEIENDEAEPDRVPDGPPGTREGGVKRVEPSSRAHTESKSGPVPEEEVSVEDVPVGEDEVAKLDVGEGEVDKHQSQPDDGEQRDKRRGRPSSS